MFFFPLFSLSLLSDFLKYFLGKAMERRNIVGATINPPLLAWRDAQHRPDRPRESWASGYGTPVPIR